MWLGAGSITMRGMDTCAAYAVAIQNLGMAGANAMWPELEVPAT